MLIHYCIFAVYAQFNHSVHSFIRHTHTHTHRMEWKETARWVKFEEDVEEGGNKWSKPHVATLSLHSLFELRSCLLKGTVLLDMRADNLAQISGEYMQC